MATSSWNANPLGLLTEAEKAEYNRKNKPVNQASTGVDPMSLQPSIAALLGLEADAASYAAAAEGSLFSAEGARLEAEAYGKSVELAGANQQSEALFEGVRQTQILRNVDQTVGGIKAGVAANGFQQSGSAIDLMRSSYSQGYLAQQISTLQSEQVQRGYLEQAAAATGEMTAAQVRGAAATALATAQTEASLAAKANAAALTGGLTQLLAGDPNAQALVDSLKTGDTAGALAASLSYNPAGPGMPLTTEDENQVVGSERSIFNKPVVSFNVAPSGTTSNITNTQFAPHVAPRIVNNNPNAP